MKVPNRSTDSQETVMDNLVKIRLVEEAITVQERMHKQVDGAIPVMLVWWGCWPGGIVTGRDLPFSIQEDVTCSTEQDKGGGDAGCDCKASCCFVSITEQRATPYTVSAVNGCCRLAGRVLPHQGVTCIAAAEQGSHNGNFKEVNCLFVSLIKKKKTGAKFISQSTLSVFAIANAYR